MESDNLFLNRSEVNFEMLIKERKMAKLMIFFSCLGILAGLTASTAFLFHYKLVATTALAIVSGIHFDYAPLFVVL